MKLRPIITSLLETDAYKFSMGNLILKKFNDYTTKWEFKCRNKDVEFTTAMVNEIKEQIDYFCTLRFKDDEIEWLKTAMPWISSGYIDFLKTWQPRRSEIHVNEYLCGNGEKAECGLKIIADGQWFSTSMYEIPILAIVNEVYFAFKFDIPKNIQFQKATIEKFDKFFDHVKCEYLIDHVDSCTNETADKPSTAYAKTHMYDIGTWSEFGIRRRYSGEMQDWLINYIVDQKIPGFVGTSNCYLAKKYGVKAVGTMAHEMFMALLTDEEHNPAFINKRIMEAWTNEYGIKNGIFLTDAIGREAFLADFDEKYATLFSGVRHDSGDPIQWGEDIIAHYKKLGIDPLTKTLLFSDALDFQKATEIKKHFDGRCRIAFGIGTYLAGIQKDEYVSPLNIVMKVVEANGKPTCKLTDNPEKAIGDPEFIEYVKRAVQYRLTKKLGSN